MVLAAVHGSLGLPGWRLFRGFTLLSPFSHSSPSLIGLLASVEVKQQSLSLCVLFEVVPMVKFRYLVVTRMPVERYRRRFKSLLSCPSLCEWKKSSALNSLFVDLNRTELISATVSG